MSHIDDTAEIITDPTAIDCGCSGGCGRMPDEMVITGTAGCAPLCIHCYTRAVREDERRQSAATPPPGTVAALLAKVEEARDTARDKSGDHGGESTMAHRYEGMRDAFDIAAEKVRATLGAPTPLDRAVGEVCAVDVEPGEAIDHWNAICVEVDATNVGDGETRESFARIARVALAGMLACDASPSTGEEQSK